MSERVNRDEVPFFFLPSLFMNKLESIAKEMVTKDRGFLFKLTSGGMNEASWAYIRNRSFSLSLFQTSHFVCVSLSFVHVKTETEEKGRKRRKKKKGSKRKSSLPVSDVLLFVSCFSCPAFHVLSTEPLPFLTINL